MDRKLIILCIVPIAILLSAFILYFTRSEVDVYINDIEVSELDFLTLESLEFGGLTRLRKIDLYNSEIEISNIREIESNQSQLLHKEYDGIIFTPEKKDAQLTINYTRENMNSNEMRFSIKKNLRTVVEINKSQNTNSIDMLIRALRSNKAELMRNEIMFDNGRISPVPGDIDSLIEYVIVSKDSRIKLIKTGQDSLEMPMKSTTELKCKFSKHSVIRFTTPIGTDEAKIRFFFYPFTDTDENKKGETMYIFLKKAFSNNISDPKFRSIIDQKSKLTISYSSKNESLPAFRANEEILIKGDKLMLTDGIKLKAGRVVVSIKGRSDNILREKTQLIDNNFERIPKFLSVVVVIIAYILDKIITIYQFLYPSKGNRVENKVACR